MEPQTITTPSHAARGPSGAFDALIDRLLPRLRPLDVPIAAGDGVIHAAVALLLRESSSEAASGNGAEIFFIKRSVREGDPWSGHIAFPGGRAATGDRSLADVAVREVWEEVGIDIRGGGRILGRLPTVEPVSRLLPPVAVTPFLVVAPDGAAARPDPAEVEDAFWMPLAALKRAGPAVVVRRVVRGEGREWPAYQSSRGAIWGITERILSGFLALVG
jgi:8-oxo-dGTP pyrophosphatase MutT (NUDIX family)